MRCAVILSVVREHSGPHGAIPAVLCRRGHSQPSPPWLGTSVPRLRAGEAPAMVRLLLGSGAGCRGSTDRASKPPFRGGTFGSLLSGGGRHPGPETPTPRVRPGLCPVPSRTHGALSLGYPPWLGITLRLPYGGWLVPCPPCGARGSIRHHTRRNLQATPLAERGPSRSCGARAWARASARSERDMHTTRARARANREASCRRPC